MIEEGTTIKLNNSDEARHKRRVLWPWLELNINGSKIKVTGRIQAKLSPHVVNLRPGLLPSELPLSQVASTKVVIKDLPQLDFLELRDTYQTFWSDVYGILSVRWPKIANLSLVLVLDILGAIVDLAWRLSLYFFLRLADEAIAISQAVWHDTREFGRIIKLVLTFPLRPVLKFVPARANVDFSQKMAWKQLGAFIVLALLLVAPFKGFATLRSWTSREGVVKDLISQAVEHFRAGGENLQSGDTALAESDFQKATDTFTQALQVLGDLPTRATDILSKIPGESRKLASVNYLLSASREISEAAVVTSNGWQEISSSSDSSDFNNKLIVIQRTLTQIKPHLVSALAELKKVDIESLPPELKPQVNLLVSELNRLESLLDTTYNVPDFLQSIFSQPEAKTYAVVFQNSSELRPTGGFMGSLAFVTIKDGQVQDLNIPGGGPYDFQGSLQKSIISPTPLHLIRSNWELQDANWFFDFPTSAKKIIWFLNESAGPQTSGVVALTPDIVIDLLKLTGPIDLPQYHKTITADNFMFETQAAVELEYDKLANRPKQFIADLAPLLLAKTMELSNDKKIELASVLERSLYTKSLQLYLTDKTLQNKLLAFGWGGEVKFTNSDYLAIVRTNIGGGKSDAVTSDKVRHQVELLPTGDLVVNLEYTRIHQGNSKSIFEGRRNVDYVRFYVPQGATLIQATGFTPPPADYFRPVLPESALDDDLQAVEKSEQIDAPSGTRITEEFGKTVFGNWLSVLPGETHTVSLSYRLPFTLGNNSTWQDLRRYTVHFQRQAGVKPLDFESVFKLPLGWRVRWQQGSEDINIINNGFKMIGDWGRDMYYGAVLERMNEG